MLKQFGEYLLEGRQRAAMMALLFSFMPFLGWISAVIIGLITLRKGPLEGLWIVLWASIADIVAACLGYPDALLFGILGGSVFVWFISWVLWLTTSWTSVLEASLLVGVLTIIILHLVFPDIEAWWVTKYQSVISKSYKDVTWLAQSFGFNNEKDWSAFVKAIKDSDVLLTIARVSTGTLLAFILGIRLIKLVLARWWQAMLFNPTGLRPELYNIRLSYIASLAFIVVIFGAFLGFDTAFDMLPVFILVFLLAGLSLLHLLSSKFKWGLVCLFIVYFLLVILTPYCMITLITIALIDSMANLRQRISKNTSGSC